VKMYRLELYNEQKIREHFGMVVRDTTWGFHGGDYEDGSLLGCSAV
jgi:hypothetical protein